MDFFASELCPCCSPWPQILSFRWLENYSTHSWEAKPWNKANRFNTYHTKIMEIHRIRASLQRFCLSSSPPGKLAQISPISQDRVGSPFMSSHGSPPVYLSCVLYFPVYLSVFPLNCKQPIVRDFVGITFVSQLLALFLYVVSGCSINVC